jgi:hypothetical protein
MFVGRRVLMRSSRRFGIPIAGQRQDAGSQPSSQPRETPLEFLCGVEKRDSQNRETGSLSLHPKSQDPYVLAIAI